MSVLSYNSTIYLVNVPSIDRQNSIKPGVTLESFLSLEHESFNEYAIVSDGAFKLHLSNEKVSHYNYLIFANNNPGAITWYCFIDSVEFVNQETTIVHYSVDTVTTFIKYATFRKSYVEREHILNDAFGVNRENEPVVTDLLYIQQGVQSHEANDYAYYLLANATWTQSTGSVTKYTLNATDFVGAVYLMGKDSTGGMGATENIENYYANGTENRIIGLIRVPDEFFVRNAENPQIPHFATDAINHPESTEGYTPKNKKCLQYPYCRLVVSNNAGGVNEYAFEDFTSNEHTASFIIYGDCTGINDYISIVPRFYKNFNENFDESLTTKGVVQLSYGGSFGLTEKEKDVLQKDIINGLINIASSPNLSVAGAKAIGTGFNLAYEGYEMGKTSPSSHNSGSNNLILNAKKPYAVMRTECVRKEIMKTYDNFFEMFGYATNEIKIPNITGHSGYNFIKTKGLNVSIPCLQTYLDDFKARFDAGITLWSNPGNIGNYVL